MKTNKFIQFALIITMIYASMPATTINGKGKTDSTENIQAFIADIELGDLDGCGQENDMFSIKQTVYVDASGVGWVGADFSFVLFNNYGGFMAEVIAESGRVTVTSEPRICDPSGCKVGSMRY